MKKDFKNNRLTILIIIGCFLMNVNALAQSCYYNVSQYKVEFSNSGGSKTINAVLYGDCTAQISDNATWLRASINNENDNIVIICQPLSTGERTAIVTIKVNSYITKVITVTQTGCVTLSWYPDTDGDTYGDANATPIVSCVQPSGYVNNSLDTCPTMPGTDNGCPSITYATFSDENYVYTITPTIGTTNPDLSLLSNTQKIEAITYFDGLGRSMQHIAIKSAPDKKDIITNIAYDAFGRQDKEWLPYYEPTGNSGFYRGDVSFNTQDYYKSNFTDDFLGLTTAQTNAYSQKKYEASPLNRVLEQAAPGKDWAMDNNHTIKFEYQTNVTSDLIRRFNVDFINGDTKQPRLVDGGMYAPNQLYKSITKDENWKPNNYYKNEHTTQEFKDKQGRVVLKRTFYRDKWHDTNYVYDDFGNLTFVLPPKFNAYASLWQQDERIYGYYKNIFSLYEPGYQSNSNYMGYYAYNKRLYIYFGDWSGPGVALKQGEVFDLNLDFNIPDGPLQGSINITTIPSGYSYENYHYTASIINGKLHFDGDASIAYKVRAYLYIDLGEITIPLNITQDELNSLAYQYRYDHRNRLIEKKIPGKYWESIVYDKLDRPVLTQDANLRETDTWLFTKYDVFGRMVYTGKILALNQDRASLQALVNNQSILNETPLTSPSQIAGTPVYYSNKALSFPNTAISTVNLYTINYYDTYNADLSSSFPNPNTVYGVPVSSNTKTLLTGTKVFVLDQAQWITSVNYYDHKARLIYAGSENDYLRTSDIIKNKVDEFSGRLLETTSLHKKYNHPDIKSIDSFTYDHMNRLITQKQKINNQETELISKNHYDKLGQLVKKDVGNTVAQPLQEIDYAYNIRGWLKTINNPGTVAEDNDLFSFGINYNKPNGPMNSSYYNNPLYNGNISHVYWQTNNTSTALRHYTYRYDAQNRFNSAFYAENDKYNNKYNAYIWEYDRNGNIKRLYRTGQSPSNPNYGYPMDYLNYTYDGNKLLGVKDSYANNRYSNAMGGFKDGNRIGDDYAYDANGNMTVDKNKEITKIQYNHLNLSVKISFDFEDSSNDLDAGSIDYVYDATGIKLSKKVSRNSVISRYAPEWTRYAGNFIYKENASGESLQFFNHHEGYVEPDGKGAYNYIYQYKDHLGNIRLSYEDQNNDGKITGATTTVFSDDFESASGWDGSGNIWGWSLSAFDREFKHSGNVSARIDPHLHVHRERVTHSNTWISINNSVATDYILSGWVFLENVYGNRAEFFLFMNTNEEAGYFTKVDNVSTNIRNKWVYMEKKVTVPSNIAKLNIRIDNDYGGKVWFDNLSIRRVNPSSDIEIVEENNYYPFGLKHKGYNFVINGTDHKYGYNGIEETDDLDYNMLEMDLRQYDPALARWTAIDPVTHHSMSTYTAFDNNPVFWADPSGGNSIINPINHASTVVDSDGVVIDHKDDGNPNIYLNSRLGTVIGQEEEGKEYKKGDKIFNVDNSNPDYAVFSLIASISGSVIKSSTVYTIPQTIPVYDESGRVIGRWLTKLKVPFKALKLVGGVLRPISGVFSFLSTASDVSDYSNGKISGEKLGYRTTGTVATIITSSAIGGPMGLAAGVVVGTTFYVGEIIYDEIKASNADTSDPDNNANTIHSIGEFRRNFEWFLNNLARGFGEGINND